MNTSEYISSGIIESYVLGLASPEERSEFERMCLQFPEVRQARDAFEQLLEKQLLQDAVAPPSHLKSTILSEIDKLSASSNNRMAENGSNGRPARIVRIPVWRYVAAASVILLLASTALNFYFFSQYKQYISKYDALLASQNQMAAANHSLQTKLEEYQSALSLIQNPLVAEVKMPGVPKRPDNLATVYWDTRSKDVYVLTNRLPQTTSDKQYQLWALVDGKPVDAGIFDVQDGLIKMKNIPRAQAFAVTLEKRGGSPSPNLEQLYVMGKVSS